MKRKFYFYVLLSVVLGTVIFWTAAIVSVIGFDKVSVLSELPGLVALEAFSHFGASFGILAALFAGLAVVLLWQSIKVQQNELFELRSQMLHDRRITEFTWLLSALESSRSKASRSYTNVFSALDIKLGHPPSQIVTQGHKLIYEEAVAYLGKRKSGDLFPADDIDEFRRQHSTTDEDEEVARWDPLMPFYLSAKQVAKYLSQADDGMCGKLYPMFASVATLFDMVVLHERILILNDQEFRGFVEDVGLFSEYGVDLKSALHGGPVMGDSAFGL